MRAVTGPTVDVPELVLDTIDASRRDGILELTFLPATEDDGTKARIVLEITGTRATCGYHIGRAYRLVAVS